MQVSGRSKGLQRGIGIRDHLGPVVVLAPIGKHRVDNTAAQDRGIAWISPLDVDNGFVCKESGRLVSPMVVINRGCIDTVRAVFIDQSLQIAK